MVFKIILYILIRFAILFGLYKMFIDDEKGVGYASFIFAVLVFLVTLIPNDKEEKIGESQSSNNNTTYSEEGQAESKDSNGAEYHNESNEDDIVNQEDEQDVTDQPESVTTDQIQDKMVYLENLDYFNSSNSSGNAFRYYESAKDNLGFTYGNG